MKGFMRLAIISVLIVCSPRAFATPPGASQHFDCSDGGNTSCAPEDTGCVPDSVDHLKCSDGVGKAFARAIKAVIECHQKQAHAALKGSPTDDDLCEEHDPVKGRAARDKLDSDLAKQGALCVGTRALTLAAAEEETLFADKNNPDSLDAQNGSVYCDGSTEVDPGGDDAGTVDATAVDAANKLKCADTVGKELGKLLAATIKCHQRTARAFLAGKDFDEEACEEDDPVKGRAALQKYAAAMDKLDQKGICTQPCLSRTNRDSLGKSALSQSDSMNQVMYPCPTTTTTTSTTTTTTTTTSSTTTTLCPPTPCACAGGRPSMASVTTGLGNGTCGHLDADGNPNFFSLTCGGLYFGGAGVGMPLPVRVPDMAFALADVCCNGTSLAVHPRSPAETGHNRCSGGANHGAMCRTDADCPGGTCKVLECTQKGCLFGPPLALPNGSHGGGATSVCLVNEFDEDVSGTADCSDGSVPVLNVHLKASLFLDGDLLPSRCSGGPTPGRECANNADCGAGGICVNDTGRCADSGSACTSDSDCPSSTCETGVCVGGTQAGKGCVTDAGCPSSTCRTLIQPCPVCNPATHKCNGGANHDLACVPGDSAFDGDYPTSHDCPPPAPKNIGSVPLILGLTTGTLSKTAVDLPGQPNVFCGFCRNKSTNQFKNPAVPCTSDASCASLSGFTSCGQRTAGAFTPLDLARTITVTGIPAGPLSTGGPRRAGALAAIFCIPSTLNSLADSAGDLPGPAAGSIVMQMQLVP